jgi:hypothetical protein
MKKQRHERNRGPNRDGKKGAKVGTVYLRGHGPPVKGMQNHKNSHHKIDT